MTRRDLLKKLGIGAAAVAVPAGVLASVAAPEKPKAGGPIITPNEARAQAKPKKSTPKRDGPGIMVMATPCMVGANGVMAPIITRARSFSASRITQTNQMRDVDAGLPWYEREIQGVTLSVDHHNGYIFADAPTYDVWRLEFGNTIAYGSIGTRQMGSGGGCTEFRLLPS